MPKKAPDGMNFFDYPAQTIDGKVYAELRDMLQDKKATLVVNVASKWGLTDSNYKELVQIYDEFKDQGLEILAYPCDQFGGQESGNSIQIRKFVGER